MTDNEKITLIRDAMPATQQRVYLNTGSSGPISSLTINILNQENTQELTQGRASMDRFRLFKQTLVEARQAMADLVKAGPDEIALTHHTTEGMNIVAQGLSWQPGDEIVTTTMEHEGGLLPLYVLRQRQGVIVNVVDIPFEAGPDEILARLEAALTPRTRLLVFSHVAWNTGVRLPLTEIVAMGRRRNVLSLVDAAQSVGAIPLDLPASGVDFYAMPGQKWLCGPEGVGALYVRRDRLHQVAPTFAGFSTLKDATAYDFTGHFVPAAGARRYEVGTVYRPGIRAMAANLTWLAETIGWDWIHARIAQLAEYARNRLQQLSGLTVITPPGPQAGLITFNLDGYDPARVMTRLAEQDIIIRFLRHPYAVRLSAGFYNTEADIDRLITALQTILAGDPEALPQFEPFW